MTAAAGGAGASGAHDCDLAVVGWGAAGFSAAITAAEFGARVVLVGRGTIGGTCVNVGCVPSKALIRAAEALHAARAARRFTGIRLDAHLDEWAALVAQKDALVEELRRRKYVDLLDEYPQITVIEGRARLEGAHRVRIAGRDEPIRAEKVVIATGARPDAPDIPGLETVDRLDSTAALSLSRLPRSLIVLGGGFVGVEMAQMFARFGVAVTIVARHGLLARLDRDLGRELARLFAREGIRVIEGHRPVSVRPVPPSGAGEGGGAELMLRPLAAVGDGRCERLVAERLLLATGRRANTDDLGLEALGVETDARGRIRVDEFMRTSHPDVFAAGDCTDREAFVYTAAHGAKIAARNALEGPRHVRDTTGLPAVVFTDPQVACAGLDEAAARARGLAVRSVRLDLDRLPRALADRRTDGFVKLVADAADGVLLGAQMLAPEAGDAIQTASLAIRQRLGVDALADMLFPYLTTVEGLKLAAQGFRRDVTKLSCCAG